MTTFLKPVRFAIAALAMTMLATAPVAAEVVVLAGKGKAPAPGTVLADDKTLQLPAGASVEVLLPSGVIRTINGPVNTPVRDLTRGEKGDAGLIGKVTGMLGTGTSDRPTGAVRSALPSRGVGKWLVPFSWADVPVEAEGDYCVDKSASLSLVRPAGGTELKVTIVDLSSNKRGEAVFPAGATRAPWPAVVVPRTGKFALIAPNRGMKQVQLRQIGPLPDRENTIRVLHGQGCELQMQAFLRQLIASAGDTSTVR